MVHTLSEAAEHPQPVQVAHATRVAWLFPSLARGFYWQPFFKEFAARFPNTQVFTSIWPGFAFGHEGAFNVSVLPGLGYVDLKKKLPDSRRGFIWAPLSILKKLAAFNPEVIFCCGFSTWTVCALLFKLLRRSRVILYWEGCSVQSVGSSRIKTLLRRWIAHFADAALTNATEGARYLQDVIGMPEYKVRSHPCQVADLPLLNSGGAANSLPGLKRPVFLYIGSISPRKGWRYLIAATQVLVRRGWREFSVVFVGAGEQAEELQKAIADLQLGDIVKQIGAVEYHNLGSYYRITDVFVSPTRADTWGVAVLEAMAFGKPVLCSKYAGSRQMVTHGENGFVFDPFKENELANYMERFIADRTLAARMGASSLEKMAPYTPVRAADKSVALVLDLCRPREHSSSAIVGSTTSTSVREARS
jgi:glycosyltransferase involved in cell wall biosynthesis